MTCPHAVLQLPDSKTGAKVVHLGQAAVDVLASIEPQPGNPHVIAGTLPAQAALRPATVLAAGPRPSWAEGRAHP